MLEVQGLTVGNDRKTYLKDVTMAAPAGQITGIVGMRGSGKTELARAIMGLLDTSAGTVALEGNELGYGDRQNFGYLPSERGGYPRMKVLEQIVYLGRLHEMTLGSAERNAVTLLNALDLSDRAYAQLRHLSGGEIARVDIASVLVANPDVVVLDEPFDGLDISSAASVFKLLREHAATGVPVIFTSDDIELSLRLADSLVVLAQGKVSAQGTVSDLLSKMGRFKARFTSIAQASAAAQVLSEQGLSASVTERTVIFSATDAATGARSALALDGLSEFGPHVDDFADFF